MFCKYVCANQDKCDKLESKQFFHSVYLHYEKFNETC